MPPGAVGRSVREEQPRADAPRPVGNGPWFRQDSTRLRSGRFEAGRQVGA